MLRADDSTVVGGLAQQSCRNIWFWTSNKGLLGFGVGTRFSGIQSDKFHEDQLSTRKNPEASSLNEYAHPKSFTTVCQMIILECFSEDHDLLLDSKNAIEIGREDGVDFLLAKRTVKKEKNEQGFDDEV